MLPIVHLWKVKTQLEVQDITPLQLYQQCYLLNHSNPSYQEECHPQDQVNSYPHFHQVHPLDPLPQWLPNQRLGVGEIMETTQDTSTIEIKKVAFQENKSSYTKIFASVLYLILNIVLLFGKIIQPIM